MNKKISKHTHYDDPTAFSKQFPRIEPTDGGTAMSVLIGVVEQRYKMGPIRAIVAPPAEDRLFYFMSIHGRDRYPTWDEIVWLRYNLIPDAAVMSLLLPNLNSYINQDGTAHKFVFTMEQKGWALDPEPTCELCGSRARLLDTSGLLATFDCPHDCDARFTINMATWNEEHGNGFHGKR